MSDLEAYYERNRNLQHRLRGGGGGEGSRGVSNSISSSQNHRGSDGYFATPAVGVGHKDDDGWNGGSSPNGSISGGVASRIGAPSETGSAHQGSSRVSDSDFNHIFKLSVVGCGQLLEHVLSQPWIIFRRQCQVNAGNSGRQCFHLTPFTLMKPIKNLRMSQGDMCLWKGLSSSIIVKGLNQGVEELISKVSGWPKTWESRKCLKSSSLQQIKKNSDGKNSDSFSNSSFSHISDGDHHQNLAQYTTSTCKHLLLKSLAIAVTTPFYTASLIESVQSEIVTERGSSGVFDVIFDGLNRILPLSSAARGSPIISLLGGGGGGPSSNSFRGGGVLSGRRSCLSMVAVLIPCSVFHGMSHYIIFHMFDKMFRLYLISDHPNGGGIQRSDSNKQDDPFNSEPHVELMKQVSKLLAHFFTDVLLYPLETVLHRLHIQGSRTIIDSLQSVQGSSHISSTVVPVITRYTGVFDCISSITSGSACGSEGISGLYKGFGSLIIQYTVGGIILGATYMGCVEAKRLLFPPSPPKSRSVGFVRGGEHSGDSRRQDSLLNGR